MKTSSDHIQKLAGDDLKRLAGILGLDKSRDAASQVERLLPTPAGLHRLLRDMPEDEYRVFVEACRDEKGVTFGQLETALKIDTGRIEEISVALSRKLLAFVLKNRQRLHNKSDKLTVFQDIAASFHPRSAACLTALFQDTVGALLRRDENTVAPLQAATKKPRERALLDRMLAGGGVIAIEEALEQVPLRDAVEVLGRLRDAGAIEIINDTHWPPCALLALTRDSFLTLMQEKRLSEPETRDSFHNHYAFLLNIFGIFDAVSTHGLFLTKQREFRKIDLDRIMRGLGELTGTDGEKLARRDSLQFCLHVMYFLGLLKLKGDSVIASLKPLQNDLDRPDKILLKIIYQLQNASDDNPLFLSPAVIPPLHFLTFILDLLARLEKVSPAFLCAAAQAKFLAESGEEHFEKIMARKRELRDSFDGAVSFLHLTGIIRSARGYLALSDIGHVIAGRLIKFTETPGKNENKETRSVYINPDFTLLVPREDLTSEELFHILTHTEIVRDDVVISAKISRQSVLRAYKRGMPQEPFLDTIARHTKNALPQNLSFMLAEWARQTVRISIMNVMILKANHPAFIDDLCAGKLKHAVVERLSPQCAVINREFLDDIIKQSQGKDAVISLFEEME
jgi:hypothetical protein